MEDGSCCKHCKKKKLGFDISAVEEKELLRRYNKLSPAEKQAFIERICKRECRDEDKNEAIQTLRQLLKYKDKAIKTFNKFAYDSDSLEDEEDEDEDCETQDSTGDKTDRESETSNPVLGEKLVGLFKAIYTKDPELEKIAADTFECMKMLKITGNICPNIKMAIQECLKVQKEEIKRIFDSELIEDINGFAIIKDVKENEESYIKVINEIINAYKLYNESIEKVVDVWRPMLNLNETSNSQALDQKFSCLIMSEFVETIWDDSNIKIVLEKIEGYKSDFAKYEHEICQLDIIRGKLEVFKTSIQKRSDRNTQHCTNNEIHPPGCNCGLVNIKKNSKSKESKVTKHIHNQKEKPITIHGKALNQLETDDLVNYINGNYKEDNSNKNNINSNNAKGKKNKKKNKNIGSESTNSRSETNEITSSVDSQSNL